jgi:hypothetical protein
VCNTPIIVRPPRFPFLLTTATCAYLWLNVMVLYLNTRPLPLYALFGLILSPRMKCNVHHVCVCSHVRTCYGWNEDYPLPSCTLTFASVVLSFCSPWLRMQSSDNTFSTTFYNPNEYELVRRLFILCRRVGLVLEYPTIVRCSCGLPMLFQSLTFLFAALNVAYCFVVT